MRGSDDTKSGGDSVEIQLACTMPIYFQIEDTTFAIPQKSLLDSEFFTSLLTSKHLGEPKEGCVSNPIKLSGISKADMNSFITVLESRGWEHPASLKRKEWASALRLSTMWSFRLAREYIVRQIENLPKLDPAWRIELAKAYDVPKWLPPMYLKLCMREESLSAEEGARLGIPTFAAICNIRERIRNYRVRVYEEYAVRIQTCSHKAPDAGASALCSRCFKKAGDALTEATVLEAINKSPQLAIPVATEVVISPS
ncbi:hypothetical protein FRC00_001997 [Tulasnella sp. 408]|nr:hypothetical protein FRC00_001997 [Tulasnella sp. 408]